jgi:hypothetical protein
MARKGIKKTSTSVVVVVVVAIGRAHTYDITKVVEKEGSTVPTSLFFFFTFIIIIIYF